MKPSRVMLLCAAVTGLLAQPPASETKKPGLANRDFTPRRVNDPNAPRIAVPRGYALVIGISKYQRIAQDQDLRFPESDAEAVYRELISQEAGNFPAENVHKLIGSGATLANIRHELEEWLPSVTAPSDRVVVFFAGHGFVEDNQGYFAPWDVDPKRLAATGYSMSQFGRVLDARVKGNKVVFIDACRSAKVFLGRSDQVNSQVGKISSSFLTLAATRENDSSYEDPALGGGFGLFSYFLVQGLRGEADQNCDGRVTADELIEYVRTRVRTYAREHNVSQTPVENGSFDSQNLVLALNFRCSANAVALETSVGDLVVEVTMDNVNVYIDDKPAGVASRSAPLRIPGLALGTHVVKGVRKGYEPDTKEVPIVPGQERSVTLRIRYPTQYKKQSRAYMEEGEKLLFSRKSSVNPLALYDPRSQTVSGLKRARDLFQLALKEDGKNARAAYELGMTLQYLSNEPESLRAFKQSVSLDPTDVQARTDYAGALIESGDTDEAIRHLTEALRLEPDNDHALSHIARAYIDKEVWDRAEDAAVKAIVIRPSNEQAHLWHGVALRQLAAEKNRQLGLPLYAQAEESFQKYLRLSSFPNPAYAKFAFYFIGFGLGRRSHADRQVSYDYQRSIAFVGLCDCEHHAGNLRKAAEYCQEALRHDNKDAIAYFFLGNVYRDLFNSTKTRDDLVRARESYVRVVALNPDFELSRHARDYLEQIEVIMPKLRQ